MSSLSSLFSTVLLTPLFGASPTRRRLWPVDNLCLAVIGIAAGCELHLGELRRRDFRQSVLVLTAAVTACSWLFIFPAVLLMGPHIGFLTHAPRTRLLSVASLTATLGVARSPASMIAVLREMEARGPFSTLVMSITVVKDVVVLILFSINVEIVNAMEASAQQTGKLAHLLARCIAAPVFKVLLSAILGLAGGLILSAMLMQQRMRDRGLLPFGVLLLSASMFLGARVLPTEPLLVCVAAGALASNRREDRGGDRQREELHGVLRPLMPWINLLFFTLAGAALAVDALADTAPIAAVIHAVRLVSLVVATTVGGYGTGLPVAHRRVLWMAMVTQAGVALGLARTVLARFPDWGGDLYTCLVSTIVLNQAVGPPLFRAALLAVGEHKQAHLAPASPRAAPADGETDA